MKFAKCVGRCCVGARHEADCDRELERDLVPEWKLKYLNYKARKQPSEIMPPTRLTCVSGRQEKAQGH